MSRLMNTDNNRIESALLHIAPLSDAAHAVVTARKTKATLQRLLSEYGETPAQTEGSQQVSVKQSDKLKH
jgi:hypothetical protein